MSTKKRVWRKSSRSANQGNCVETAKLGAHVGIRDSKLGDGSPVLRITGEDFSGLLASMKR